MPFSAAACVRFYCYLAEHDLHMRLTGIILLLLFTAKLMAQSPDKKEKIRMLALGDSYTIGESVTEKQRWPVQLISQLRTNGYICDEATIIARTGWRTDDLKNAIHEKNPDSNYTLVSLLVGVNNQYQGKSAKSYAPEFEELLKMAIGFAGGDKTKVFVVSIPDYGFTPFGKDKQQEITKEIDEYNHINKTITEKQGVKYFNITEISRQGFNDPELVAEDGLHPSGKMYGLWVDMISKGF
jgi:lysophospholipase L1-like esterase